MFDDLIHRDIFKKTCLINAVIKQAHMHLVTKFICYTTDILIDFNPINITTTLGMIGERLAITATYVQYTYIFWHAAKNRTVQAVEPLFKWTHFRVRLELPDVKSFAGIVIGVQVTQLSRRELAFQIAVTAMTAP